MANKTYCPIMTIGFEAPQKGKRDNRICMKDCAWYNLSEEKCNINIIAEHLEMIESLTDDMTGIIASISPYAELENEYEYYKGYTGTGYYNNPNSKRT